MKRPAHTKLSRFRVRLHDVLEAGRTDDHVSIAFDVFIISLILLNVAAFAMGTVESVAAVYGQQLEAFNVFSVLVFTAEYLLRLWVSIELPPLRHLPRWKARFRYARSPLLIIDFLAIAPFYLAFLFNLDLRVLRVLRLLRVLKLAHYSPALHTLARVMKNERSALIGAAIIMCSLLLFSATIIYFLEREAQPVAFGSVPAAAWWALSTLTTVGYGDVTPVTALGKMFGGLVMIFGLGMFALPIGIMATGFSQESHRSEFVITWSTVARVPLFAELNASMITEIMKNLRAQSFPAGAIVVRPGEQVTAMFFIVSGEVLVEHSKGAHKLEAGHIFGEAGILADITSTLISARASSNCDLMILDRHDFEHIMREHKDFAIQINRAKRALKSKKAPRAK